MNDRDLEEYNSSQGRIKNGATIRTALAVRNAVLSTTLVDDLRVVMQLSEPSTFVDAACFLNDKGQEVMHPLDISVFLNTLLFKSAAQPGLARVLLKILDFEGKAIRRRKAINLRGGPKNEPGYCCREGHELTFEEMEREYETAIFIGIVRPSITDTNEAIKAGLNLCPDPKTKIMKE